MTNLLQTEPFGIVWHEEDGGFWYNTSAEIPNSEKIAAFDMDHTIIVPKSKAKFAANRKDWFVRELEATFSSAAKTKRQTEKSCNTLRKPEC